MHKPLTAIAVSLLLVACAPRAVLAPPRFVDPSDGAAPYSRAVITGELVFLAGVIGSDGNRLAAGGIEAETEQAIRNIESALSPLGLGLDDVVKCTVFLADIGDFSAMNGVYTARFPAPRPARTTIGGADVVAGARIEIECIAARR